jgi:hypothetical protein
MLGTGKCVSIPQASKILQSQGSKIYGRLGSGQIRFLIYCSLPAGEDRLPDLAEALQLALPMYTLDVACNI